MLLDRAGKFVTQLNGYKAFIPHPLPPDPPLRYDEKIQSLLSEADRALARLEGVATLLSNRDLFVAILAKKEALLSSQRFRKYLFVDYIDIIARGTEICKTSRRRL